MKKSEVMMAFRVDALSTSFYKEGYEFIHYYQESLGSSYRVKRLRHGNGNIIDIAFSIYHKEIVVKKNGLIIKRETV